MFNIGNKENYEIDEKGVRNVRGLVVDMIDNANSGHPGICLGAATILYTLFKRHMNIYLDDTKFLNRDRFVLSAGHGAPLYYVILYLMKLLTMDDLKNLRKINSKTPGHPEYLKTPLVEMSTGPLGQGIASSVGMAISENYLHKITNGLIDHYTYVLCGDGELEEGVTYEALSLAGTLKLQKFIVICDYNKVTLDNELNVSSKEDLKKRFESINFLVLEANDTVQSIDNALIEAKNSNLPCIIFVNTIIGYGSFLEGKNIVHGKPLAADDILNIHEKLGLYKTPFTVNQDVLEDFYQTVLKRGEKYYKTWLKRYQKVKDKNIIDKLLKGENTVSLTDINIEYNNKSLRELSGDILNFLASKFPFLIGGSCDLSSSCKTNLNDYLIFSSENRDGRNIYFGIREHAMSGVLNGMALSGLRPFGSTFLTFSDYMKPGIRMSAMMNLPVIYIFTHDSITVGEDGPTHHPIEQLASLSLIPNLKVYRPYDLNELIGSYMDIMNNTSPSALILPRDNKEISELTKINGVFDGMYVVLDSLKDDYINLITNGEELGLVLEVAKNLRELDIGVRVISIPCLKNVKPKEKAKLLEKRTIGITLGVPDYLYSFTNEVIGITEFSLSGSKEELLDYFGFTVKELESKILELLNK